MSKEKWEKPSSKARGELVAAPVKGELVAAPCEGSSYLEVDIALLCFDLNFEAESCCVS